MTRLGIIAPYEIDDDDLTLDLDQWIDALIEESNQSSKDLQRGFDPYFSAHAYD